MAILLNHDRKQKEINNKVSVIYDVLSNADFACFNPNNK